MSEKLNIPDLTLAGFEHSLKRMESEVEMIRDVRVAAVNQPLVRAGINAFVEGQLIWIKTLKRMMQRLQQMNRMDMTIDTDLLLLILDQEYSAESDESETRMRQEEAAAALFTG